MGKKILLADDSITIQKVIELTFSDEDFDVVTVGNGRLALEKVQEVRPDIILCDIIMPEKDGYEVCEFIKKSPAFRHIPVLLLTGAFEPFDQERAARVGSDGFLAKPFEPETLIAKVKELLSRAAAPPPASSPRPSAPSAIPFVALEREPQPPRPSTAAAPPPLSVVPPRPPEPIPFPRAAGPEPLRAGPPPVEPRPPVSFIPEEPFENLDAASFDSDDEPSRPLRASEPIPFHSAAEELLPMTPEESQSLGVPDTTSTVMFQPNAVQWQTPPPSPPPTPPAAAEPPSFEALPVLEAELAGEPSVFEEVIEEDVDFGGAYMPVSAYEPASPPAPEPPRPSDDTPARSFVPAPARPPALAPERAAETVEIRPPAPSTPPAAVPPPPSKPPASTPRPPAPTLEAPVAPPPPAPGFARPERSPGGEPVPTVAIASPWLTPPAPSEPPAVAAPSAAPSAYAPPFVTHVAPPVPERAAPPPADSFADLVPDAPAAAERAKPPSEAAEVAVPVEMVEKIAQRVVAQISEKVVREIAWDVIPDLAEQLIKAEIERLKAELQRI